MVQPVGAFTASAVIANALAAGLVTPNSTVWAATPPSRGLPLVTVIVGRLPFAACTGDANGIKKRNPDSKSNARIVPELNLVRYVFVDVYILFSSIDPRNCIFK